MLIIQCATLVAYIASHQRVKNDKELGVKIKGLRIIKKSVKIKGLRIKKNLVLKSDTF